MEANPSRRVGQVLAPHGLDGLNGTTDIREIQEEWIFSGSKRTVASQDFRGGHAHAIFAGINLDLTAARIVGEGATLDVVAIFGGVEIRYPPRGAWKCAVPASSAGSQYRIVQPPATPETKRLIVTGGAVFGGVAIKD